MTLTIGRWVDPTAWSQIPPSLPSHLLLGLGGSRPQPAIPSASSQASPERRGCRAGARTNGVGRKSPGTGREQGQGAGPEGRLASQVQAWIPANPVATAFPCHPPSPLWLFHGTQPKLEGAAYSHDSFHCFFNLKIKAQRRHLQGDACFIKGLCSQRAQGWSGAAGWALGTSQGLFPGC